MIINADDFGYSPQCNEAIAYCFKEKLINRTTIMVNMPYAQQARDMAFENGFEKAVGLHLNFTEGKALSPLCGASELCDEKGEFKGTFYIDFKARFFLKNSIKKAIEAETEAQVKKYLEMGFSLMHADSHNYTHTYLSVWQSVKNMLKKYGFKSLRISRNIPQKEISVPFKIYKKIINNAISGFKTAGGNVQTTKFFGSVQDFEKLDKKEKTKVSGSIEFMTHPTMIDGVLEDNTLPNPHPMKSLDWIRQNGFAADDFAGKKPQILVTFIGAHIGGAMTALVNFLNSLDTHRYDVDVLFYKIKDGERWGIKDEINILPAAKQHESYSISNILKKLISPSYMIARFWDVYYKKIKKNKRRAVQIMSKQGCRYFKPLEKHYDIAIAFEYSWALNYLVTKVNASKKIAWHHLDFKTSGLAFNVDKKAFNMVDKLVFVSENCMQKFVAEHPQYKEKSLFMPNILTSTYVRQKGEQPCDMPFEYSGDLLKLLTVARVSFEHKGIDRGVEAFKRLKDEGLLEGVRWTVVGKGRDLENLQNMIAEYELGDYIFPVGAKENPIPYMKNHDALFLPSRHEGKPMVVTEAQIMGLVPVVTNYTSAHEQIKNGIDGIVVENSGEAVYKGIEHIIKNREILSEIRQNIINTDYGNEKEIERFYALADELL